MMTLSVSSAVFWIAVIVCAVAQVGILRATRSQAAARARATTPAPHRPATRTEELAWATLPVLALALVLALTWRAVHARSLGYAPPAGAATVATGDAA